MKIHIDKFDDGCPKLVVEHTIEELKDELGNVKGENLLLKSENKKLKKQIKKLEEKLKYCKSEDERLNNVITDLHNKISELRFENGKYYEIMIAEKDLLDVFFNNLEL